MKRKLLLIALLAFSGNAIFPATPTTAVAAAVEKKDPSLLKKILNTLKFPLAPSEVTHTLALTRSGDEPYKLDTDRIEQLQKMYEHNFSVREKLAKATYLATAGSLIWLGYKWGIFDWVLPKAIGSEVSAVSKLPSSAEFDPAKSAEYLKTMIEMVKAMQIQVEANKEAQAGNWLVNQVKNVGWTGITIAGSLILQSKWYSFFGYALVEPSFKWFLSNHSMISTIDRVKRSVQALSSPSLPAEFSHEYHTKALVPAIESLIRNTEQFIGFIDFYLPLLEDVVVKKEAMNDISRYLFNITNDFLQKMNPVLKDPTNQASLVPIIDEYRADVATFINRCKVFEEEFFPAA